MIRGQTQRTNRPVQTTRKPASAAQPKAEKTKPADPDPQEQETKEETQPTRAVARQPKAKLPAQNEDPETMAVAELSEGELQEMQAQGMEEVGFQDVLIPRLLIAQAQSNQRDENSAGFIEGAEEGHVCNTGMKTAHESVLFCPVAYRKFWIEWPPREEQQNRIIQMHTDPAILRECRMDKGVGITPDGNRIQETAQFYGWHLDESGGLQECFIAMASTQLRKAKQWLTMAQAEEIEKGGKIFRAPLWWRVYELGSQRERNDQGRWMGWTIDRAMTLAEWSQQTGRIFGELKAQANNLNSSIIQIVEQATQSQGLLEEGTVTEIGAADTGEPGEEEAM